MWKPLFGQQLVDVRIKSLVAFQKIMACMSALGCDFNRSMQHLISNYREEDVEDEAATENILHRV